MNEEAIKLLKVYNDFNGADIDRIGFIYNHNIYYKDYKRIPKYLVREYTECSKRNHAKSLIIHLTNKEKEKMIRNKAVCLGSEQLLQNGVKNRGDAFEKLLCDLNGIKWDGHNSKDFTTGGDININGIEIQCKLIVTKARLTYYSKLKKLASC